MKYLPRLAAGFAFALNGFAADSTVIFNEIHDNPTDGPQEFIELRNLNGVDVHVGETIVFRAGLPAHQLRLSMRHGFRLPRRIAVS